MNHEWRRGGAKKKLQRVLPFRVSHHGDFISPSYERMNELCPTKIDVARAYYLIITYNNIVET